MKNVLILHGTNGHSQHNWFPWLKGELEKKGYQVWVPDLPGADRPNIERYNQFILPKWRFNEESVMVGHSSGAVAILGLLQELPDNVVIDKAILVAGFVDDLGYDPVKEMFARPFNWEKIKKQARKFIFIHSDDDPNVPSYHGPALKERLGGELVIMPGQKHFSVSTAGEKYREFPELLSYF